MNLSSVRLLTQSDIKPIYQRVTIILTIVMVFYVTLEVVKYVLDPDKMTDKEKGASKVVQKMIIVIMLIAFVPTIFDLAYTLQNSLVKNQIFSKIILGEVNTNAESYGKQFSASMFGMFYYFDAEGLEQYGLDVDNLECDDAHCQEIVELNLNHLETEGKMPLLHVGLNETEKVNVGLDKKQKIRLITFDGLLAVVVGALIAYMLVMYCIDVGVRIAQMMFLQVIAPIPIIGYLAPKKDGIFQKWVKQCVTTYLDLFIRIIIIYFIMLIIGILGDAYHSGTLLNNIGEVSRTMKVFMYVFIVLGLMLFASKAPKMLKELFPSTGAASGNFGLKAGERIAPLAARTIGAGLGLARTGIVAGITRGRNVRKRNKDLMEKLRAEGKPTDRKSMSEARKEARKNFRTTRKNKKQSEKSLDTASKEYNDARRKYEKLEKNGADKKTLEEAKTDMENKQKIYEARRKGYDTTSVARAKSNLDAAKDELDAARNKKAEAQRNGTYDSMSAEAKDKLDKEVKDAEDKFNAANKAHEDEKAKQGLLGIENKETKRAKEELDYLRGLRARETDPEKQKALDEQIDAAQKKYEDEYVKANSGYIADRNAYEVSRSNLAEERNQTFGALAGFQAAGAAVRGAVTGATTGAKATKLGDIGKNVAEGGKKVQQREVKRTQFLEDGGSATFTGTVDRTIAREQQKLGIRTESERIKEEVKHLERDSKILTSQASMEGTLKGAQDEAENRSQTKIEKREQKIQVLDSDRDALKIKTLDGKEEALRFEKGNTTSQVYEAYERDYTNAENTAKADADAYANAQVQYDPTTEDGRRKIEAARIKSEESAALARKKKFAKEQALKKLKEYAITRVLRGEIPATSNEYDVVLDSKIKTMRSMVDTARSNARTVEWIETAIREKNKDNPAKAEKMIRDFRNNTITDYDTYDIIQGLLTGHSSELKNEASQISEQIRVTNESKHTEAANATAASTSSGGK